jgi:hypothetical protein|nr:MAG TPA: hypothetical protein [Crassvirales sp.]
MINIISEEYRDGNKAINNLVIKIFSIPIYKCIRSTTNPAVVDSFRVTKKPNKVRGFSNETKN